MLNSQCMVTFHNELESSAQMCGISLPAGGARSGLARLHYLMPGSEPRAIQTGPFSNSQAKHTTLLHNLFRVRYFPPLFGLKKMGLEDRVEIICGREPDIC